MANLLAKFRINYSSLVMVQISEKPKDSTVEFFNTLIADFRTDQDINENGKILETSRIFQTI